VLNRLQQLFPHDYNFHPRSFEFPEDLPRFRRYARRTLQPDAKPSEDDGVSDEARLPPLHAAPPSLGPTCQALVTPTEVERPLPSNLECHTVLCYTVLPPRLTSA
jgi:hypothetical protein